MCDPVKIKLSFEHGQRQYRNAMLQQTDFYALSIAYFKDILNVTAIYRTLPLILIVPFGVSIGTKLFTGSTKENYKKYVLYFLILISIFGLIKAFI